MLTKTDSFSVQGWNLQSHLGKGIYTREGITIATESPLHVTLHHQPMHWRSKTKQTGLNTRPPTHPQIPSPTSSVRCLTMSRTAALSSRWINPVFNLPSACFITWNLVPWMRPELYLLMPNFVSSVQVIVATKRLLPLPVITCWYRPLWLSKQVCSGLGTY